MPIEIPRGLPFSVDTWSSVSKKKRHHFLTHAHKDHTTGISTHYSYPIYCTHLTKTLLQQFQPQLGDSLFVGIEVGQLIVIDDSHGIFTVTAFDANHCPGAVMFLFEGNFGNILHTGDCRLTPECLQLLPEKYLGRKGKKPPCQLDYVFLDCTFGSFSRPFPIKHSSIQQVINCIWKHPEAPVVYLSCDLLGQEEILTVICETFGSKIYVNEKTNSDCFNAMKLTVPQIVSQDPSSRFHIFDGFPKLYERAKLMLLEAQANLKPEPLIIRPSSQWYACNEEFSDNLTQRKLKINEAVRDEFGVWHVCYSMHSSREELEWALQLLAPKWVISTTPSCRAMELNYAKKHCFSAQLSSNNSLWKLLDISDDEVSSIVDVSKKEMDSSSIFVKITQGFDDSHLQPIKNSIVQKGLILSSPNKKSPVTLFGRARLGLQESALLEDKKILSVETEPSLVDDRELQHKYLYQDNENFEVTRKESVANKVEVHANEVQCEKDVGKQSQVSKALGSPKGFSECMGKLYRSMNVPVPQPLPSLMDLLKANKRAKRH